MKKLKKVFLIFFILTTMNHCGYKLLYNDNMNQDIKIVVKDIKGNNQFNTIINSKLRNYKINNSKDIFYISWNSDYQKTVITKNSSGVATDFKLVGTITFKIKYKEINDVLTLKEDFNVSSNENSFSEKRYVKTIQNNFANSMVDKLLIQLNNLK